MVYVAGIANFEFTGNEFSVRLNNLDITIKKVKEYASRIQKLKTKKSDFEQTSEIVLISPNIINLEEVLSDICWLLSFAKGTYIDYFYTKTYSKEGVLLVEEQRGLPFQLSFNPGNSVVDSKKFNDLLYFLKKCYLPYAKNKERFKLPVIIHYYLESISHKILDIRFLLLYITLECIVSHCNKFFVKNKQKGKICGECKRSLYSPFQKQVEELLAFFSIKHFNIKLLDERNDVIHRGKLEIDNANTSMQKYAELKNVIDRIILSILEYDGSYLDCNDNNKRKSIRIV